MATREPVAIREQAVIVGRVDTVENRGILANLGTRVYRVIQVIAAFLVNLVIAVIVASLDILVCLVTLVSQAIRVLLATLGNLVTRAKAAILGNLDIAAYLVIAAIAVYLGIQVLLDIAGILE